MSTPVLSRRALVRASAASVLAAPFLPRPARATAPPLRLLVLFSPNGTIHDHWRPQVDTGTLTLPSDGILGPLARHAHELVVLDGLDFLLGDNHEGGMADMLTAGGDTSLDQHIARARTGSHRFDALTLGAQTSAWGGNVQTRMSYRDGTMVAPDDDPASVWSRLFSGGDDPLRDLRRQSIIDGVLDELSTLRRRLGTVEQARLDDHISALRDVERSLFGEDACTPTAPPGLLDPSANDHFPEVCRAQLDLAITALACGSTSVASVQLSHTVSPLVMGWLGHTAGHHSLSHASDTDAAGVTAFVEAERWFAEQVAYALDGLAARADPETGVRLLDQTLVLWAKELGDGRAHTCVGVPWVVAGGGLSGGRLEDVGGLTHDAILTELCQLLGTDDETFGQGTTGSAGVLA